MERILTFEILEMLIGKMGTPDFHLSDTLISELPLPKIGCVSYVP